MVDDEAVEHGAPGFLVGLGDYFFLGDLASDSL
jgi:hypothetical protein